MNILYLSAAYVPSRRASAVQVMKMCGALAAAGHSVTLVAKRGDEPYPSGIADDAAFYGIEHHIDIRKIPRPQRRGGGLLYAWHVWRAASSAREIDLVYTREVEFAGMATLLRRPFVLEAHDALQGYLARRAFRWLRRSPHLVRFAVNSRALRDWFERAGLLPDPHRVVIARNAADVPAWLPSSPPQGHSEPRIGYVGNLYGGRGVEIVVEVARQLPGCSFHIIGGTDADLRAWRMKDIPTNCIFHGFLPPSQLGQMYSQLDILLMPYQREVRIATGPVSTAEWMCPMKMFEYMAAARPIISSDLPVLREVLEHGRNALLVAPDDAEAWVRGIRILLDDPELGGRLGQTARADLLAHYTWRARAATVLAGLSVP